MMGSIAYKLALIAAGRGDLTVSFLHKNEWDVCAGALLVREAGGGITDLTGKELVFNRPDPRTNGVVAGNSQLHGPALQWFHEHTERETHN